MGSGVSGLLLWSQSTARATNSIDISRLRSTFSEEFRTPLSLFNPQTGKGRWKTTYDWGGGARTLNDELEVYSDQLYNGINPFKMTREGLAIVADIDRDRAGPRNANKPYTSGLLTTSASFRQLYGYFEMKAALPAGAGLWPTFWLNVPIDPTNPNPQYLGEIDIVEMLGKDLQTIYYTAHYPVDDAGTRANYKQITAKVDGRVQFRSYGLLWTKSDLVWYIDRKETGRMANPGLHRPMMIFVNLAVGGAWGGPPNADTRFPAQMVIRYIRAYREPDFKSDSDRGKEAVCSDQTASPCPDRASPAPRAGQL